MKKNRDYMLKNRFPVGYTTGRDENDWVARPMLFGGPRDSTIRAGMWTARVAFYTCVCLISIAAAQDLEAQMMEKLEGTNGSYGW